MKLKKLVQGIDAQIKGSKEIEITGICSDSRCIAPGYLFIAKKGSVFDAKDFIAMAIQNGAVAVLSDSYDPF